MRSTLLAGSHVTSGGGQTSQEGSPKCLAESVVPLVSTLHGEWMLACGCWSNYPIKDAWTLFHKYDWNLFTWMGIDKGWAACCEFPDLQIWKLTTVTAGSPGRVSRSSDSTYIRLIINTTKLLRAPEMWRSSSPLVTRYIFSSLLYLCKYCTIIILRNSRNPLL